MIHSHVHFAGINGMLTEINALLAVTTVSPALIQNVIHPLGRVRVPVK